MGSLKAALKERVRGGSGAGKVKLIVEMNNAACRSPTEPLQKKKKVCEAFLNDRRSFKLESVTTDDRSHC